MKINKKLILLLMFVMIIGILGGCGKKAPEGVSQAFYDDMIDCIKKVKNADSTDGYSYIIKYEKVKDTLSEKEQNILKAMDEISIYVLLNTDSDNLFFDDIEKHLEVFTRLMDVDIDIDKIVAR